MVAEGADEFAVSVEDEDRRMIGLIETTFVDDVDEALAIDGNVVRGLPSVLVGKLEPGVIALVVVIAGGEDRSLRCRV